MILLFYRFNAPDFSASIYECLAVGHKPLHQSFVLIFPLFPSIPFCFCSRLMSVTALRVQTVSKPMNYWKPKLGHTLYANERTKTLTDSYRIRGCIQKFQDRPPGATTANGTALCH